MPIYFNSLVVQSGLAVDDVILIRHQDRSATRGRTPYQLWRDERPAFESYQQIQGRKNRVTFSKARIWASFVGTPDGSTMFVGMYAAEYRGPLSKDAPRPHNDGIDLAENCDIYDLTLDERFLEFQGKLYVEWGLGKRGWFQWAHRQDKALVELRRKFSEPDFPGFLDFKWPLSKIKSIPAAWITALENTFGVYVLTCPKTKELYVGKASGTEGFFGRWCQYVPNNHGGNIALMNRDFSDFQVSILEVAGTPSGSDDISKMEQKWKQKLHSREMGLNRNL